MTYDITSLKRKVLSIYPFFGSVAAGVEYRETDEVETIKSSGNAVYYNPRYMSGLSDSDRIFLLSHELCHIAFAHESRGQGKDPMIWEKATDAVINQLLKRDGLSVAAGGVDYPEAIDYDAEQYYEILLGEKLDMELEGGSVAGQENPAGSAGENRQVSADDDNDDGGESESETELIRGGEEESEESEEEADDTDGEYAMVEEIESKAGNAVRQDIRTVDKIGSAAPLIDWRVLLRDSVNYGVDWSYADAVIEDGIVRPVLKEIALPETEIVLDTSWSVDEELLRNFLRECKNILQFSKLKVGCFDTVFYGFRDIRTEQDIEDMVFEGGGGTDFNAAADAFTLRVDNRIIFTDGEAPIPDEYLNAIWVVCGDEAIEPKGGTVIHIRPEQLKKRSLA